jgi:hypothetical protein
LKNDLQVFPLPEVGGDEGEGDKSLFFTPTSILPRLRGRRSKGKISNIFC